MMKKITDFLLPKLFMLLVLLAPLSKLPSLALPTAHFTSFRIGLYQLLALGFVAVTLFAISKHSISRNFTLGIGVLLVAIALLGLFDGIELGRSALLTVSFLFLLSVMASAYLYVSKQAKLSTKLIGYMLKIGIVYSVLSAVQLVIATAVTSRYTLLCIGCGSSVFGFPRVNVFAAEPLFWANALIPFFVIAFVTYTRSKSQLSLYSLMAVSVAIALTFARGAFFAVLCIVLLAGLVGIGRHLFTVRQYARSLGLIVVSFLVGFILLVGSAVIHHKSAPYIAYNTTVGMVEHLTLGKIKLATKNPAVSAVPTADTFVTQGRVVASENDRIGAAKLAERAWTYNAHTFLFGVGLGNLGPFVVQNVDGNAPSNLTVYIFYALFISEMGLVGLLALLGLYVVAFKRLMHKMNEQGLAVLLILVGFLVHYFFFGSYINVVYIWLWLGIGLGLGVKSTGKHEHSHKKVSRTVPKV